MVDLVMAHDFSDSEDAQSLLNDSDFEDEPISPANRYSRRRSLPLGLSERYSTLSSPDDLKLRAAEEERISRGPTDGRQERYDPTTRPTPLTEDSTPVLDAGPLIKPPPDYEAATANREEEQRLHRAQQLRALGYRDEEDFDLRSRVDVFGSEHPLVRNGLLGPSQRHSSMNQQQASIRASREEETRSSSSDLYDQGRDEATTLIDEKQIMRHSEERPRGFRRLSPLHWCVAMLVALATGAVLLKTLPWQSVDQSGPGEADYSASSPIEATYALLPHPQLAGCVWSQYHSTSKESPWIIKEGHNGLYNPFNMSFVENLRDLPHNIRISGTITISTAPDEKTEELVQVDIASTPGLNIHDVHLQKTTWGGLELLKPIFEMQASSGCMDVRVNILLPKYGSFENFTIHTTNFDIDFAEIEFFKPKFDKWEDHWRGSGDIIKSVLHATRGNIAAQRWGAYQTEVTAEQGSITGVWPLLNNLTLNAHGDITVSIAPMNSSTLDEDPFPWTRWTDRTASLDITSTSGSITTEIISSEGQAKVPDRDFITRIKAANGSVNGDYLLGSKTSLETTTGRLSVRIIPVYSNQSQMTLQTEAGSGDTRVWFVEPILFSPKLGDGDHTLPRTAVETPAIMEKYLAALRTVHRCDSGYSVYILPLSWAGIATLRSQTGNLDVLHSIYPIFENTTGSLIVKKEGGNSTIDLQSLSGSIDLEGWGDIGYR